MTKTEKVRLQEEKDYYVVSRLMFDNLFNRVEGISFIPRPEFSSFDMTLVYKHQGKKVKEAVEIKARNKSPELMEKYPYSELKVAKFERVMDCTKEYDKVYYIQLVNEQTAYLYNLREIDFTQVKKENWNIKKVQFSSTSTVGEEETYMIPYTMGKRFDNINQYYKDFYKLKGYANTE